MRTYVYPAAYQRAVEAALDRCMLELDRDEEYRSADDERIREWASVPADQYDADRHGMLVLVARPTLPLRSVLALVADAPDNDLGDHLHAIALPGA